MDNPFVQVYGTSFTPPYPRRWADPPSRLALIGISRRNVIGAFREADFSTRTSGTRMFRRHVHVVNHPRAVRQTLVEQADIFEPKSPQQRHALSPLLGDGLFVSDGGTWRERRQAVANIVHGTNANGFVPIMQEVARQWLNDWHARPDPGKPLDVLSEMGELTAEIISRSIFGRALGRVYTNEIVTAFAKYQRRVDILDLPSLLGLPDWMPRIRHPALLSARRRVHAVIDTIIDEFAAGKGDTRAVVAKLFQAKDSNGEPLTREAVRNEAIVILWPGMRRQPTHSPGRFISSVNVGARRRCLRPSLPVSISMCP